MGGLAFGAGALFTISTAGAMKAPNFEVDQNGSLGVSEDIHCDNLYATANINASATRTVTGYISNNNYGSSSVSFSCNRLHSTNATITNLSSTVTDALFNNTDLLNLC